MYMRMYVFKYKITKKGIHIDVLEGINPFPSMVQIWGLVVAPNVHSTYVSNT